MPSDKPKVTSYLEVTEKTAFDKFCDKHDYSNSEGVSHLIREQLIKKEDSHTAISKLIEHEDKLTLFEDRIISTEVLAFRTSDAIERLYEIISQLQSDVDRLSHEGLYSPKKEFTDEDIADITGQPVEKVVLWRKGAFKPRGCRILEKLRPFEIVHGQWLLRNRIAPPKSVKQNV